MTVDDPEQLAHPAIAPLPPTATLVVSVTVLVGATAVLEAAAITIGTYPLEQVKEEIVYTELSTAAVQADANEAPKVN